MSKFDQGGRSCHGYPVDANQPPLTVEPPHKVWQTGRIIFEVRWVEQVGPFHNDYKETKETCQQVDSIEI